MNLINRISGGLLAAGTIAAALYVFGTRLASPYATGPELLKANWNGYAVTGVALLVLFAIWTETSYKKW